MKHTDLANTIKERLKSKPICLMTHVIAGYPSVSDNMQMIEVMAENGVDVIEIQLPFSEPSADGPLFTFANQEALKSGMTTEKYFALMSQVTSNCDIPILMMGYYNCVYQMGERKFINKLKEAGGRGFIIPDLPIEEGNNFYSYSMEQEISPIAFMTPFSTNDRLKQVGKAGSGFVYVVSRQGVTGKQTAFDPSMVDYLNQCRQATNLPLAVGFGVSKPDHINFLKGKAQMAIIGTNILKTWMSGKRSALKDYLQSLSSS